MRANPEVWSHESFLAVHNWWHLALFHLSLDEIDEEYGSVRQYLLRSGLSMHDLELLNTALVARD